MINLDTFVANELGISLNNFIYNSISIFKYDTHELTDYIKNKCDENPLIYISEDRIPLSALSDHYQTQSTGIFTELFTHFNCTLDEQKKTAMQYILYSLNSSGFLEADTKTVSDMTGSSPEEVQGLLNMLKAYDDRKGIGCTDVYDFLRFQLRNQDMYNEKLFTLFISNLDAINSGALDFLEDDERADLLEYVRLITESCSLSPISEDEPEYLEPDATISVENRSFNIVINDYLSDCIVFEPLDIQSQDKDFKKEMEKYRRDYEELASILNARKMYLSSVLTIIVNKQRDFLLGTSEFLNPLDQNDLADATSLSPATISRLLAGKFVSSPKGTVPIKSLLSKKCCNGASVSYAMHLIKSLSDFETMPDSKISKKLCEFGVTLSRRTVNKYKNEILSQN
ncbi:hypothetical protein [Salinicoccus halodurans]|uniref:RNA polymerase, sigma 54 subunit, RpoN/SigL n=1 Tax=Salinicoccus halodurans TaxID=407035 RepID=A0A0F7HP49_9STAP|nr:hypothetical protein [Salinicoccus halodurans]AKG74948.1 hypothetical protein AAT16_12580 [Salinicoccus halodurans]SFK67921.1 RNA polymerase, sigma 54 subunit, RpoN/SigL [Salinicoccus halodurans]